MNLILSLVAAHFIGDFAFQSSWMSEKKGESWEINFYHSATYTATFVLLPTGFMWWQLAIILISHIVIDAMKARWRLIKSVWMDQVLHFIVLVFLVLFV